MILNTMNGMYLKIATSANCSRLKFTFNMNQGQEPDIMSHTAHSALEVLFPRLPGNNTPNVYTREVTRKIAETFVKDIEKRVLDEWNRKSENGVLHAFSETTATERKFISDRFMAEEIGSEWSNGNRDSIGPLISPSAGYYPPDGDLAFHEDSESAAHHSVWEPIDDKPEDPQVTPLIIVTQDDHFDEHRW